MRKLNLDLLSLDGDELRIFVATEVVAPCIALAFEPGELRRSATTVAVREDGAALNFRIELRLETSAGDVQTFWVWEPHMPILATVDGMRRNLLRQLEDWLPESQLRWGQDVQLLSTAHELLSVDAKLSDDEPPG